MATIAREAKDLAWAVLGTLLALLFPLAVEFAKIVFVFLVFSISTAIAALVLLGMAVHDKICQ